MESNLVLGLILLIALIGKAHSVALAAALLLVVRILGMEKLCFPVIAKAGVFGGLVLLLMALLIPLASGEVGFHKLCQTSLSFYGFLALVFSCLTTYLSGLGLNFLTQQRGELMPALILGAVIAAAFLGGVPVGPLITSGLLALIYKIWPR